MSGVLVRPIALPDVARLDGVLRAAYGTVRSFLPLLRHAVADAAAVTFVAEFDGAPAGMATLHDYGAAGYLAQVGVDPAYQRRGLARALTEAILATADARGHRWLELDATPAGAPLYRSLGFADDGETVSYEGPSFGARARALERAGTPELDEIAAYDRSVFGADRSATIARWLADPAVSVFVTRTAGALCGYVAARGDRIAPWLALDDADALALLDAAREALAPATTLAFLAGDGFARRLLEARGYYAGQHCTHMVRGTPAPALRQAIRGRISLGEG